MDEMIESIKSSIVKKPGIPIRKGDLCFFMMPGSIGTPRNESVVTTKTGPGIGIRIPITKHFGLGISKRKVTTTIKNEIKWDKKNCTFYMLCESFALDMGKNNIIYIDNDDIKDMKF